MEYKPGEPWTWFSRSRNVAYDVCAAISSNAAAGGTLLAALSAEAADISHNRL